MRRGLYALTLVASLASVSGCSTVAYYAQAVNGQYRLVKTERPISAILKERATPAPLRTKLQEVARIRRFAVNRLDLPDNGSYRNYVALKERYVAWNVYASPRLSLRPRTWCFPIAGCVAYRGYFSRAAAERYARHLHDRGYDVYVAGVIAYSTLGWFRDPILSSMLRGTDTDIAALIFHELAHQKLYIRNDTTFDESFAVTVSRTGVRRWLKSAGDRWQLHRYLEQRHRDAQVMALLLRYRSRLEALYASTLSAACKLRDKQRLFAALRAAYVRLEKSWGEKNPHAGHYFRHLNNAYFVPIGAYNCDVSAFKSLLASVGGKLPAFYARAKQIGGFPAAQRHRVLATLRPPGSSGCRGNGQTRPRHPVSGAEAISSVKLPLP